MKELILFDIDGTIADDRHRYHLAMEKRWSEYFDFQRMMDDDVWGQGRTLMISACQKFERGEVEIGYLTGRRIDTVLQTRAWLLNNGFPTPRTMPGLKLHMKPLELKIPTPEFKAAKIRELRSGYSKVILFDDDPDVCRAVSQECGYSTAVHCTWNNKPAKLIELAEI